MQPDIKQLQVFEHEFNRIIFTPVSRRSSNQTCDVLKQLTNIFMMQHRTVTQWSVNFST